MLIILYWGVSVGHRRGSMRVTLGACTAPPLQLPWNASNEDRLFTKLRGAVTKPLAEGMYTPGVDLSRDLAPCQLENTGATIPGTVLREDPWMQDQGKSPRGPPSQGNGSGRYH